MGREKTSSITHLVKIVVEEVIEERNLAADHDVNVLIKRLYDLEKRVADTKTADVRERDKQIFEYINKIQSSTRKAGEKWSQEEDHTLIAEITTAVAQMAQNHGRTKGSIISRIKDKNLLWLEK